MTRPLVFALVLLTAGLWVQSPAAPPTRAAYVPDLRQWRLDVSPALGGWSSDRTVSLRVKLVDPNDPNPPQEEAAPPRFDDEGDGEEVTSERAPRTADALKALRLAREAEAARSAWRQRTVKVWFNGEAMTWSLQVGTAFTTELTAQNGENRLELLEPDSGQKVVRSWWVSTSRTRLRVMTLQGPGEYVGGSLQVLEPDGALATGGRRTASGGMLRWSGEYTHDSPPPGTYTLTWSGGWRGGKPGRLKVEAVLDGGTDQERRWTWERLILPGTGPVTLGTFDVEP